MKKYLAMLGIASMLSVGAVVAGATPSLAAAGMMGVKGDIQDWTPATNHVSYWQGVYSAQQAVCYKSEGNSSRGTVTDNGMTVTLSDPGPWVALIIKGGNVSNDVISDPKAGVAYASPLNSAGQQADVSHWIVCTGTTPPTPKDAVASATANDDATCDRPGTVTFAVTNASWQDAADTTDGSRVAVADNGHLFNDGKTEMTVTYTVFPQKTGDACAPQTPKDAVASATANDDATCDGPGTVTFAVTNASWQDPADTTDGSRVAVADNGHEFTTGGTELTVTYTLAPQKSGRACAPQTPQDAVASATANNDATCDRPGTVTFAVTNASWQDPTDTTDGSRVAVADNGHEFTTGGTELTVTYTLAPKKTGPACVSVLPSVAVAAPVLTPPTCTAAGVLTYSDHLGYTWNRQDDNGNVVLTATPKPGFTLTGQTSWSYTAAQLAQLSGNQACPPAVIPPEVEGVKHEAAATLPRTGSESGLYGAAGLLLLMVGSGLVLATRTRSTEGGAH